MRFASLALPVVLGAAGAGCGLVYDLSALGPGPDDAGAGDAADAALPETGAGACPSGKGASMVVVAGAFCIDTTEATNAQYAMFLDETRASRPALPAACDFKTTLEPGGWATSKADLTLPVRNVDWCDALSFCRWAGKRLCGRVGGGASLRASEAPSAALSEWALACTKGGTRPFPYGASYEAGRCTTPGDAAAPLPASSRCEGGFDAVLDMVGNVAEWVDACESERGNLDECRVMGGSFLSTGDEAKCSTSSAAGRGALRPDQGIRCCAP